MALARISVFKVGRWSFDCRLVELTTNREPPINSIFYATVPRSGYDIQPRVAALRGYPGNRGMKRPQPQRGYDSFSERPMPGVSETDLLPGNRHNPVGVVIFNDSFPRVAAQHGNPGLYAVTASRYCRTESDIDRASRLFEHHLCILNSTEGGFHVLGSPTMPFLTLTTSNFSGRTAISK